LVRFLIALSFTALVILGLGLWGMEILPTFFYQTLIFLFITTGGLYRFLLKTKRERPDYFIQLYLLTMVVKLIAYSAYLFIVVRSQPQDMARNIVFFMAVYFVFTAIEIGFLYRQINR